jgi:hypothetical protein
MHEIMNHPGGFGFIVHGDDPCVCFMVTFSGKMVIYQNSTDAGSDSIHLNPEQMREFSDVLTKFLNEHFPTDS